MGGKIFFGCYTLADVPCLPWYAAFGQTVAERGRDFYRMNRQGEGCCFGTRHGRMRDSAKTDVEQGQDFYRMNKRGRDAASAQGMGG